MLTHRDMPGGESLSTEQQGRIMNAVLMIGDQTIMASDSPPGMHAQPRGVWVSLMIDRLEDAKRAFEAFAEGGSVMMPFGETFWAPKGFGMVTDRYGTQWMINCVEDAPAF
jgi:PhnB protein